MNTALVCGLIILVVLAVLLIAGVPIAVALGISSVCAILPIMDTGVAVLTGAQRIFSGIVPQLSLWLPSLMGYV